MPRKASQSVSKLLKRLEIVFNLYIRLRDSNRGSQGTCISCGRFKRYSELDAGHLFTAKASKVRFDERNVHAQCQGCNRFQADAAKPYYVASFIRKYDLETFFELEKLSKEPFKWTRQWLEEQIEKYDV